MRWLYWTVAVLAALGLGYYATMMVASETAEVVVVHVPAADGTATSTRLWVVDHDGSPWLRAGHDGSGWLAGLLAAPAVTVERDGTATRYRAVAEPAARDAVNALMEEKYAWRETVIGALVGGRAGSVPIRLVPAPGPEPR